MCSLQAQVETLKMNTYNTKTQGKTLIMSDQ